MKFNAWLIIGIIGISVFGSQFMVFYGRAAWGDANIWWTPKEMALPLLETSNDFELILKGELLRNHLDHGSLLFQDRNGELKSLSTGDLEVRLNNWHQTRASLLHSAVFMALLLGVSLMSLIIGLARAITAKRKAAGLTANGLSPE